MHLTPEHIRSYEEDGYAIFRGVTMPEEAQALRQRIDDIMMGAVRYEGMFFQLDPSMKGDMNAEGDSVWAGPSRNYRKIKDLEYDDLFLRFMQKPMFREMAERYIGPHVASMRAMIFNKPARSTTLLPYHQDVSEKWDMTIPPVFTIWTALDEATIANGCLEIVPKSHHHGRIGIGHMITPEEEAKYAPPGSSRFIPLKPGESIVFHNAVLHRSGANNTDNPRRGFTMCMMDGATRHTKTNKPYPIIFGEGTLTPEQVAGLAKIPPHVYEA